MKEWKEAELRELSVSSTELDARSGDFEDGAIYDKDGNYVKPTFSGECSC